MNTNRRDLSSCPLRIPLAFKQNTWEAKPLLNETNFKIAQFQGCHCLCGNSTRLERRVLHWGSHALVLSWVRDRAITIDTEGEAKRNKTISELTTFTITEAKAK